LPELLLARTILEDKLAATSLRSRRRERALSIPCLCGSCPATKQTWS
ncbi:hypothetical protein BAE44_0023974, partial [Dichanthelium oligosanthes]